MNKMEIKPFSHPQYHENRSNGHTDDFGQHSAQNYRNYNHQHPYYHSQKEVNVSTTASKNKCNPNRISVARCPA